MSDGPRPDLEERLARRLAAAVADVEGGPALAAAVDRERARLRRVGRWQRLGAVAAVAALLAGGAATVAVIDRPGDGSPDDVRTEPGPAPSSTSTTGPEPSATSVPDGPPTTIRVDGPWSPVVAAPIQGRTGNTVAVWTGDELVIWGHGGDEIPGMDLTEGAAYDPVADAWRRLPPSPILPSGPGAVWTGTEVVVGPGRAPDAPMSPDAVLRYAAYDPAADSWRVVPGGPVPADSGPPLAWTGDEVLTGAYDYARVGIGALDPVTGSRRRLPDVPNQADSSQRPSGGTAIVALDDGRVAAVAAANASVATVSVLAPGSDRWEVVSGSSPAPGADVAPVWTGDELLLLPTRPGVPGAAYAPDDGSWRELAAAPAAPDGAAWSFPRPIWTGTEAFTDLGRYDPAADAWRELPAVAGPARDRAVVAWAGDRIVRWSGLPACVRDAAGTCTNPGPATNADYPVDGVAYRP